MSDPEVDFTRLFQGVRSTVPCESPGHDAQTNGCQTRYTEATWVLRQTTHVDWVALVCVGYAARFRAMMASTMTCPVCGETGPLSDLFQLNPINVPHVIDER